MNQYDGPAVERAVAEMLGALGDDPAREGIRGTPGRVARAWREMLSGYGQDPAKILSTDFDAEGYDQVVAVPGIEFASVCEHHLLPFTGTVAVAYLPGSRVVGLSKMARLVECFARRLQIQERMTQEIAGAINSHLGARGVAVVVEASHSCMALRGVKKPGARMVTSCMLGCFREIPAARAEVLELLR